MDAHAHAARQEEHAARASDAGPAHAAEVALIRAALAGDEPAQRALFDRLCTASRVITLRNVELGSPLSLDEIDDLVQETLLALWRKLGTYDGRVRLETWAAGFALLELLQRLRKRRRFEDLVARAGERPVAASSTALPHDTIERVHEALDGLDDDEATVVRLKHFEDLPFESIARALNQAASTVKTRYYRALGRLRIRLGQLADEGSGHGEEHR